MLAAAGIALKDFALERWYSARLHAEDSEVRAQALAGLERMFVRVGPRARRRLLRRLIAEWSVLPAPEPDQQLEPIVRLGLHRDRVPGLSNRRQRRYERNPHFHIRDASE